MNKKNIKKIVFVASILVLSVVLIIASGIFGGKKVTATDITCPPGYKLCGDACYPVTECCSCITVNDCATCGAVSECPIIDRRCNGGSGGGPHYCYCVTPGHDPY